MHWYEVVLWGLALLCYAPAVIYACSFAYMLGKCKAIQQFMKSQREESENHDPH
jgi:hypothetical protein